MAKVNDDEAETASPSTKELDLREGKIVIAVNWYNFIWHSLRDSQELELP